MSLTAVVIGVAVLAGLFFGLPYYQAYKRRQDLARREQAERERKRGGEPPQS